MLSVRSLARHSKVAIVCHRIVQNWRMRSEFAKGSIEASIGSTHSSKSIEDSLAYIELQYRDYCRYADITSEEIKGKRIIELGCGDNVGVALKFLSEGASQVTTIDKFYSKRDEKNERRIYLALRETLDSSQREKFDQVVDLSQGIAIDSARLCCVYGKELSEFGSENVNTEKFDIVLSRAVIEEIYEPKPLFQATDQLLNPGGLMIHKIDLRDYGMFSGAGMNPLTFLTIPEWIYRRMASESGLPNRKTMSYYCDVLEGMGYQTQIFITSVISKGEINPHKQTIQAAVDYDETELSLVRKIRSKLDSQFSKLSDEELLVDGIFLVAQKPRTKSEPA